MINAEKYRDKLLKFIEEKDAGSFSFSEGEEGDFWQCAGRRCSECGMSKERSNCSLERLKWLLSEYKEPIKLTRFEHDVLKHLLEKTQYRFIVREKSDNIYIYKRKPKKGLGAWDISTGMQNLNIFVNLFPFIKWEDEEATSIQEVLNNCEVVDDVL